MLLGKIIGRVDVTLTSADLPQTLAQINRHQLSIYDIVCIDEFSVRFSINKSQINDLQILLENSGETIKVQRSRDGVAEWMMNTRKRPVLAVMILIIVFLTCWLPSRILFISVEGNVLVPDRMIIEEATRAGLSILSSRRAVRNENIKNSLLENVPRLQWVGINTDGCRAVITVRERMEAEMPQIKHSISSIISKSDGIVRQIVVERGTAQCRVGDAVKRGQVLISAYTNCGLYIKGTGAVGEVYGDTIRRFSVCAPQIYHVRQSPTEETKKYSIIIGKKQINLYKGSGISGAECAKIYEQKYLTLPGGFALPIGIGIETIIDYQIETQTVPFNNETLSQFAAKCIKDEIQSGNIRSSDLSFANFEEYCCLSGIYYCYEMIGMTHIEERVPEYE